MCGITGFSVAPSWSAHQATAALRSMGRWTVHRGPDDWGEHVSKHVALGHNRLSIIDIATGQQPMSSACGGVTIVFNGEIYNFRDLWRQLQSEGLRFQTDHSDTEVILNGFLHWGDGVFARLDGMFALAIWDSRQGRLLMARDRLGIKPLYFAEREDGGVVFASEPKAIVGAGFVRAELRPEGVSEFLFFRAPRGMNTLFRGIRKLAPGHTLSWRSTGGLGRPQAFWRAEPARPFDSDALALQEVERTLTGAVRSHLVADVPVGSFLSGGVDSSLVTAIAARERHIDSFTIGSDSEWDETEHAANVASHLGVPHHVRRVAAGDFLRHVDDWQFVNDDPCADPSALALMLLSEFARSAGMKVMLAGEGSDELFGGYNAYSRFVVMSVLRSIPGAAIAMRPLLRRMNPRSRDYLTLATGDYLGTGHLADLRLLRDLLAPDRAGDVEAIVAACRSATPGRSPIRRAMELDQRVRLPDDLLMRTDRASMYFSIEARVPFLDNHMIDCAARLTDSQCIGAFGRSNKRLLKRLAERFVPRSAIYRPKRGFDLPVGDWLRQEFMPALRSFEASASIPCLNYRTIGALLNRLAAGENSRSGVIWAWFVLENWHRLWIQGPTAPRSPSAIQGLDGYRKLNAGSGDSE